MKVCLIARNAGAKLARSISPAIYDQPALPETAMNTKEAYARENDCESSSDAKKRSKARAKTKGKKTATVKKIAAVDAKKNPLRNGVLVLNEYQFEHFYKCMTKPAKPTKMMQEATARIWEMSRVRR